MRISMNLIFKTWILYLVCLLSHPIYAIAETCKDKFINWPSWAFCDCRNCRFFIIKVNALDRRVFSVAPVLAQNRGCLISQWAVGCRSKNPDWGQWHQRNSCQAVCSPPASNIPLRPLPSAGASGF